MSNKVVGILASLIVVLGIAVLFNLYEGGPDDESIGHLLFPDLGSQLDSLKLVEIVDGENSLGLQKDKSAWGVRERGTYAVDFSALSAMITNLSEAKLVERKTARKEKLGLLGLSDEKAVRLNLITETSKFSIYLGETASGRSGHYVRFPDDAQAWLIDKEIEVKTSPQEWLKPVIINVASDDIDKVIVESPDAEQFEVRRVEGEDNWQLSVMAVDQKLKYPGIANELSSALVNVRLKDLVLDTDVDWSDAWKVEFHHSSGSLIHVMTMQKDQQYLMNFRVEYDQNQVDRDNPGEAIEAEGKNAENGLEKYHQLQDYVFEVGDYVYGEFARTSKDFIDQGSPE